MARVVVIGAGVMGLAAAYRAVKLGHDVDLVEAAPEAGGMAAHFDFEGVSTERFYHFVCKTDDATFALLEELGLRSAVKWRPTSMGIFTGGRLHRWGDPVALIAFPHLSPWQKLRYGVFAWICSRRDSWPGIENETAKQWIVRWCGEAVYERLWKPLLEYKFYEHADEISAAWVWRRIRRIGRSRRSLMQEELGYIEGGSATLVDALVEAIRRQGGRIHLGDGAQEVTTEDGHVTGVRTAKRFYPADAVICTAPTPYVSSLVPSLPEEWKQRYAAIRNIAVICVVFKLRRSLSPHFWVNISETGVEIPGVIEFTNLRDVGGDTIVYVPHYLPATHPRFSFTDQRLTEEAFACLRLLQPDLAQDDVQATRVARMRYGQPICEPGFAANIPPVQTPIAGLQIADTCFYYPEDRGIAESVHLGRQLANQVAPARAGALLAQ